MTMGSDLGLCLRNLEFWGEGGGEKQTNTSKESRKTDAETRKVQCEKLPEQSGSNFGTHRGPTTKAFGDDELREVGRPDRTLSMADIRLPIHSYIP